MNHDLTTETSSLNAAELIKKEKFDIFIVDFQMPDLNGIELLKKIKNEYKDWPYISILATAYGTIHLFKKELVHEEIFHYFIEKPFEIQAVKQIICKAFINLGKMKNKTIQFAEDTE